MATWYVCDHSVVIAKKEAQKIGNGEKEYRTGKPMQFYCSHSLARSAKLDKNARPTMMIDECRAHYENKTVRGGSAWITQIGISASDNRGLNG